MSAPAAPRPARSTITSDEQRQRQPRGLRPEPDGDGRHERAEQDEPARLDRCRRSKATRAAAETARAAGRSPSARIAWAASDDRQARRVAHRPRRRHPEERRRHRQGRRHGRAAEPLAHPQLAQARRSARPDRHRARRARRTAAAARTPTAPRTARPRPRARAARSAPRWRPSRAPCRSDSRADAAGGGRDRNRAARGRSSPSPRLRAWTRETADGRARKTSARTAAIHQARVPRRTGASRSVTACLTPAAGGRLR